MNFKLTDQQRRFLNITLPFSLFEKYNTQVSGEPKILEHILATREYTQRERIRLNAVRLAYIKWKQNGSNK
jgi:hypothetical protein